jgi:hypothetical protein
MTVTSGHPVLPRSDASGRVADKPGAPALNDERERRGRLLLLGKGAVLAHHVARALAAESDDQEQSGLRLPRCMEARRFAAPFARIQE